MNNTNKELVRNFLGDKGYLRISRAMIKILGGNESILLREMIDWQQYLEDNNVINSDDIFYFEQSYIEERLGMSEKQQRSIITGLSGMNLISWERKGIPPRNHYKINYDAIAEIILQGKEIPLEQGLIKSDLQKLRQGGFVNSPREDLKTPRGSLYYNKNKESNNNLGNVLFQKNTSYSLVNKTITGSEVEPGNDDREPLESSPVAILPNISVVLKTRIKPLPTSPLIKQPRQQYNQDTLAIINYWNTTPGLPHHKFPPIINDKWAPPTKLFERLVKTIDGVIQGNFFNSVGLSQHSRIYSKDEIILAIQRYILTATSPKYYPINKEYFKSLTLERFFYDQFSTSTTSYFLECLHNEPKLMEGFTPRAIEINPQLTKWLKEHFVNKIYLGQPRSFNSQEENKFIKGANLLHEAIRNLRTRLNLMTRPEEWCKYVLNSLIDRWGITEVKIGHIGSEYTYSDILVKYLEKRGRVD